MHINKLILLNFLVIGIGASSPAFCAPQSELFKTKSAVLKLIEVVEVPAAVSGKLTEVNVQVGSQVQPNQLLARIDDGLAGLHLESANSELEIARRRASSNVEIQYAEKTLQVAKTDLERAKKSNRSYKNVVPPPEMDRLRLLVEQSSAEKAKLEFEKQLLQMNVSLKETAQKQRTLEFQRHQIRSDFQGQVTEVNKQQGEWVDISQPVIKIVRTDRLRIEEYIELSVATPAINGAVAQFTPTNVSHLNDRSFAGKVVFVSPEVNPLNSKVRIWIEIDNSDSLLRPGVKGQLSIQSSVMKADADSKLSR